MDYNSYPRSRDVPALRQALEAHSIWFNPSLVARMLEALVVA